MKNFNLKLWQYLNHRKKADSGFTLIELLVVIIIIGILSAIALPSFLIQANKAKEVEAQTFLGNANKEQNGYYIEKTDFKTSLTDFDFTPSGLEPNTVDPMLSGLGLSHKTENYFYGVRTISDVLTIDRAVFNIGFSTNPGLKSYLGVVYIEDGTMKKRLCKAPMSELQNILIQVMAGNIDELESEYCN